VKDIYEQRLKEGFHFIGIACDLNDTPEHDTLCPLLGSRTILVDIMSHPKFIGDEREGTHRNATKGGKLDYIIISPQLTSRHY
jgi:hypothetical protein